ncbi:MAG TPA: NADH-quinone oxidoreductase subunit N [Candidatus Krumholzibacteria bacterium]|nr:NADH-quinone oxidoreductase subunit N [Candidatus Krumholzibacteria bacterium]HRX50407.1 NADH-quinone oxidoreductase subunit N [Candidatus Krumholzibacteria bacterium]
MTHVSAAPLASQLSQLLPYLILAGGALLVMLVDSFVKSLRKEHLSMLTLLVLLGVAVAHVAGGDRIGEAGLLHGMLAGDQFAWYFNLLFVSIALLTTTFASGLYDRDGRYRSEFYPLVLLSTLGMMLLTAATDLMSVFLAIETMSLAVYVLVAGNRGSLRSSEAGFKYLILGAFSSAFLLMGMALLYGQTGGTSYAEIGRALARAGDVPLLLKTATGLILVGFGFKVAMVPFHMWTPDVYEGAPAYVTGFMATGVKAAATAALLRFAWLALPVLADVWFPLLAVLTVLTMTLGNVVALSQNSIKRMLAYSSIAHAGYLLLGVLALLQTARTGFDTVMGQSVGEAAGGAVLFYLVAYALMNLGAFGLVTYLSRSRMEEADTIAGYAGLARRRPVAAAAMAVFMFSLAGIPPAAGFVGKFYIFDAVVKAGLIPLAIWGVINSLISVFYYLRVIMTMYMKPADEEAYEGGSWESVFAAAVLAVMILALGVLPGSLHGLAVGTFRSLGF